MNTLPIQPYDLVMLAVLALATLFGLWKGMAWQIASVASLVVSILVAMRLSGPVAPMISAQAPWNRFIAMLLLYLATSAGVWLAFRLVAGIIDRVRLKQFDHQVGALFGLAKGALLCLVITFFAVTLSESLRQDVLHTYSGRTIARLIKQTTPIMPDEVRKVLGSYIEELDRKLDPAAPPETPPGRQRPSRPLPAALPGPPEEPRVSERPIWTRSTRPPAPPAPQSESPPPDAAPADSPPPFDPTPRFGPAPPMDAAPQSQDPPAQDPEMPLFPVKIPSRDRT